MLFRDVEHQRAYREGSNAVMLEDAVRDIRYSNFGVPIRVLFRLTPVIAPYLQLDWNMLGITGNGTYYDQNTSPLRVGAQLSIPSFPYVYGQVESISDSGDIRRSSYLAEICLAF